MLFVQDFDNNLTFDTLNIKGYGINKYCGISYKFSV